VRQRKDLHLRRKKKRNTRKQGALSVSCLTDIASVAVRQNSSVYVFHLFFSENFATNKVDCRTF